MSALADRWVRRWLFASAIAVALTLAVGGITRLTESGLSITEWRPVSGILPPRSTAEWEQAYRQYLQIPEAQSVHRGITFQQFRVLYWWEWVHRLLARAVGLILAVPFFVLWARRRLPPRYRTRLLLMPLLVAAQGALGWYMVQSGLAVRTDVSAYRLAAHLLLALVIFLIATWTLFDLQRDPLVAPGPADQVTGSGRRSTYAAVALVLLTMVSGAFVAGLDAGRIFNTFPLMGGQVVPPGYRLSGSWLRNALENPIAAQFHHRVLAIGTALVLLGLAWKHGRPDSPAPLRRAALLIALSVVAQVTLGITTLLLAVPVALGVAHQLAGLGVLTAALLLAHRSRASAPVTARATQARDSAGASPSMPPRSSSRV